jgi:hypothetical protein
MRPSASIALLVLCGCAASHQYFEPSERVQGQTVQGYKVAIYALTGAAGVFGEAKVWSHGAYAAGDGGNVVHIGLEIHNTGKVPIELRPGELRLDVMHDERGPVPGLEAPAGGAHVFAPGAISDASFLFELPPAIGPGEVVALRLHWRVHAGDQLYAQRTPFIEERDRQLYASPYHYYGYHGYPCWPYGPYDCMHMHPYGAGLYGPVYVPHHVPAYRPSRSVVKPKR